MYCPNCGGEIESSDRFCSKCGSQFRFIKKQQAQQSPGGCFFITLILLLSVALVSPFAYELGFGECGTLNVNRAIRDLESYAGHIREIESASANNLRPPSYLISQIDGDYMMLSNYEYDLCIQPASKAMLTALLNAVNLFSNLPLRDANIENKTIVLGGEMLERKYRYEDALREYYSEIGILKACSPLCNLDKVFTLQEDP